MSERTLIVDGYAAAVWSLLTSASLSSAASIVRSGPSSKAESKQVNADADADADGKWLCERE